MSEDSRNNSVQHANCDMRAGRCSRDEPLASEPDLGKAIVICSGNPLRGDDGLGWHVAQALTEAGLDRLEVIVCHQLTPELAETLGHSRLAIFVDASVGSPPGALALRVLEPLTRSESFTHHLEPAQLLGLARELYGRAPRAVIISVGAETLGFAQGLSPAVEASIPRVLEAIRRASRAP